MSQQDRQKKSNSFGIFFEFQSQNLTNTDSSVTMSSILESDCKWCDCLLKTENQILNIAIIQITICTEFLVSSNYEFYQIIYVLKIVTNIRNESNSYFIKFMICNIWKVSFLIWKTVYKSRLKFNLSDNSVLLTKVEFKTLNFSFIFIFVCQ